MLSFFSIEELTDPNLSVTDRNPKGAKEKKTGLDIRRLTKIREICLSYESGSEDVKDKAWRNMINSMSIKMSQLGM
jgi:hypothetical protein